MKFDIYKQKILIIDFGSQYSRLIVRRIREIGVYCDIFPWNIGEKKIKDFCPSGIILSGGPKSVTKKNSPYILDYIFKINIPILGICYGMHIMSIQLGGKVKCLKKREFGNSKILIKNYCRLFQGIKSNSKKKKILNVWMSHSDAVIQVPPGFKVIAVNEFKQISVIANDEKKYYGIQFHPEVTHTNEGKFILKKFVLDVCNCKRNWKPKIIIENIIKKIKLKIKKDYVILGISGGLDSLVTALLLKKAIGKQLICIFIDNGLLRFNESKEVLSIFNKNFKFSVVHVSAEKRFLQSLVGVSESELKRKIIGHLFIKIFEEEAKKIKEIKWLAQGTINSDVIESSNSINFQSESIKSHHNVGGLPNKMKLKLIEPLKNLFKDEVKKIGLHLGLAKKFLNRHPFPGPGLSVRILGEVKKYFCDLLRKTDSIFIEELQKANLYNKLDQAFTVFLPIRSVGVRGDRRKYDWVIALRAVKTIDFMTAEWVNFPSSFLQKVSKRIVNEVDGISRVVYDITNKPPSTIEWE